MTLSYSELHIVDSSDNAMSIIPVAAGGAVGGIIVLIIIIVIVLSVIIVFNIRWEWNGIWKAKILFSFSLFRRKRRKQFNDSEHIPLQSTNVITEAEQGIIIIM